MFSVHNRKILSIEKEAAMKAFYSLHSQRPAKYFLRGYIEVEIKRRSRTNSNGNPRSHSFSYYFRKGRQDIQLCKICFSETNQVSDGRIYKCYSKI